MEGTIQEHKKMENPSYLMMSIYHEESTHDDNEKMMMMNMARSHKHHDDDAFISDESSSSSFDDDDDDSSDLDDDHESSSSSSNGPLYELSQLMDQLPIKRGLSKFYQGKSQSFTSLARVTSLEDLAKKESPYQRKLKACMSYGGGLNNFKSFTQPKATISKKASKGSLSNLSCLTRKSSFIGSCGAPLSPVQSSC